jgi:hypothetical protein
MDVPSVLSKQRHTRRRDNSVNTVSPASLADVFGLTETVVWIGNRS